MKRLKKQFTLATCIRANRLGIGQMLNLQGAGFTCIYDFGDIFDVVLCRHYLRQIGDANTSSIRLRVDDALDLDRLVAEKPSFKPETLILALPRQQISLRIIESAGRIAERVFVEVYTENMVLLSQQFKADGIVIRGNEAGGICSAMSNPAILRSIRDKTSLPIWIYGGIGPQSALAYAIGGADGVILSDSLLLLPELAGDLSEHDRNALESGIRTQAVDIGNGLQVRISESYPHLINRIKELCAARERGRFEKENGTDTRVSDVLALMKPHMATTRCCMGEEVAWALEFGRRYATIPNLMQELNREMFDHHAALKNSYPLGRGNGLANELKAEFPILQGPMTHVSDCPDFLAHVARNGAIPFAALALNKGERLEVLMRETQKKVGGKPWGVGILGFAPKALQEEQFALFEKYRPDIAIVAGGRPSHYRILRSIGIIPFLHTPVPSMITAFFKEGVRHFIFEGRGCGGHIGPINSYPLWQSALIAFQQLAAEGEDLNDVRIAFAGGIYDAVSAAMTSAFCVPLREQGVQFGFIVGTAYLFTREIRESAAITPAFQQVALNSERTVILESRVGHGIRCAPTALTAAYDRERAELFSQGMTPAEVSEKLEKLHIGRLRLAAKGVKRAGVTNGREALAMVSETDQMNEGLFMIGESVALLDRVMGIADLHRWLCHDAVKALPEDLPAFSHAGNRVESAVKTKPTDIAIIGMSIIAPGSENMDRFWHNILAKLCCIDEVPGERWRPSVNFNPDPDHKDTTYSNKGGFLADIPINCMEYGIPPGSVAHIEPAQLLALEAAKQALIDSGYEKKGFDHARTSVIFGVAGGGDLLLAYTVRATLKEYMSRARDIPDAIRTQVIQSLNDILPEWTEDSFPGILNNVIAGRVANRFNLNGVNFTVDAACASSMAALQAACQELAYGTSRTAIVGGVDTSQHMFGYMCFGKSKALSVKGQSKPFSQDADGIVLGEGVGVVVLKRLADAIDDGDRIYAVIKGIGGASDGKGSGMTVPLTHGQRLAIDRACEVAGIKTDTLDLIEAHGTGTPLGDRVELETIHKVLQDHGATLPCAIGSIKSAIGHTKAAAGVIGVIKATLALYHKVLPAHINADTIHPAVSSPQTRLYLNTQTRPWLRKSPQRPRRAGVSAFGFGGTNFHAILEEYGRDANDPANFPRSIWPAELFLFGAPDTQTLIKNIDATLGWLEKADAPLPGLAYQHYAGQIPFVALPVRLAVKADSVKQLKEKLVQSKMRILSEALRSGAKASENALRMADGIWGGLMDDPVGPLTALFPGQGAQKLHMLKDLAVVFPVVRACLDHANAVLAGECFPIEHGILTDYIYPANHEDTEAKKQAMTALTQTQVAQPALAAVEMALFYLLAQFNVQPKMAAGHSFGELTALWSAGVMTDRQLLTLASERGRCMAASSKVSTGMIAVHIDRNALSEFVDTAPELTIANHNTPKQVAISGSIEALKNLEAYCRKQKWRSTRLPVSQGFHSPYMANAGKKWHDILARQDFLPTAFPVYANMTAKPYGRSSADITGILAKHLQNGVAFVDQIEAMHAAGARTFIEIGPGSILTSFVKVILADQPHHAVAVQPHESASGIEMLLDCLAALHARGYPVDLRPAYACRRIITEEKTNHRPSATLFLVNGGKAKPTVELKARKHRTAKSSIWDGTFLSSSSSSSSKAPTPPPTDEPTTSKTALQPGQPEVATHSGYPMPSRWKMPEAADSVRVPAAARSSLNHQEKLKQLKQFQKSINLFLETQERFQKQRLEMMEKMWNVNQKVVQQLLGSAPAMQIPAPFHFASGNEAGKDALNARTIPNATASLAGRSVSNASDGSSPPSDPLPNIAIDADDPISRPAENAVRQGSVEYRSLLLEVIAERTQYPVEMLATDQDIEADLGIDSIKRVEIITMLRDLHPSLNDIADEKYYEDIAQLRTLGDIVTWIDSTFGSSHGGTPLKSEPQAADSPMPESTGASPTIDYRTLLFDVISERTQYPVEMLATDQDIEADLGIDSIKRVEIITMLRNLHPSLSDIADEKYYEDMAQLRTLGDIVTWIDSTFGSSHGGTPLKSEPQAADSPMPESTGASPTIDYRTLLFDVISERTQYPVEMLATDQDIEADLGIDSIKRVEIITMLRDLHPSLSDIADEKYYEDIAQLRTLGDIVTWIDKTFGRPDVPGSQQMPSMDDEQTERPIFQRYVLRLIEQPRVAGKPRPLPGVLLILDGGHPLGKQIQTDAEKRGIRCLRVQHGSNGNAEDRNSIRLNATGEKDYTTCYYRLKTSHGIPCGVLNLLALGKRSHEESDQAVIQSFLWAKTMGGDPDLRPNNRWNLFWLSVTGMGGDFGLNGAMDFEATQNGLHGITKCLHHEWPGVQAKTVDIHPEENLEMLSRFVLGECSTKHDGIEEIGFFSQQRHALALIDRPHERADRQARLNSNSVLLITGGAKGITVEVAMLLAKQYQPTMIIVGRTPLPERSSEEMEAFIGLAVLGENDPKQLKSQIINKMLPSKDQVTPALVNARYHAIMNEYKVRQNIEKMRRLNAKVFYYACDCTNEHGFAGLIRQTYKRFHKIDGVIHAAGCLKDAFVTQKTTAHFKQVLDTKVKGARILLRELDFETLDFITFFSSVSGRFGNRGQVDYAAANEILNKMAVKLDRRWPGKAVAINWGPWEGEGMVSSQMKEQFLKAGVYLLPRDLGAQMLSQEIHAADRTSEVVIFGARDSENRFPIVHPQHPPADSRPSQPFAQLFKVESRPTGNSLNWTLNLDRTAPYLNDHRIDGLPVLAAAMAMEIMAQAALAVEPDYQFKGIQQFELYKGIRVTNGHPLPLMVTVDIPQNGPADALIADVRMRLPNQINRCNYSCRVLLGKAGNEPVPERMRFIHSRTFEQPVEDIYESRLFHRGVFRALKCLESFEITDPKNSGIKGIIEPSSPEHVIGNGSGGLWLIDPIVFDCAYQMTLLWAQERYGVMGLPSNIGQYRRYRAFNGKPVHCEVAIKNARFPRLLMDFIFTDEHGDLYAKASDVVLLMSKGLNEQIAAAQREQATVIS